MNDDLTREERLVLAGVPSFRANPALTDPDAPGFVPVHERSPREQARFFVSMKQRQPRPRAIMTRADETRRPRPFFPTNMTWATED